MSRLRDAKDAEQLYKFGEGDVMTRKLVAGYQDILIRAAIYITSDSPECREYGADLFRKFAIVLAAVHRDDVSHRAAVTKPRQRKNPDRDWLSDAMKTYRIAHPKASCAQFCTAVLAGRVANVRAMACKGGFEFTGDEKSFTVAASTVRAWWAKVSPIGN